MKIILLHSAIAISLAWSCGDVPVAQVNKDMFPAVMVARYGDAMDHIGTAIAGKLRDHELRVELLDEKDLGGLAESARVALAASNQAYVIAVAGEQIRISASGAAGALHGLSHLEALLMANQPLPEFLVETPALELRALHFVLRRTSFDEAADLIRRARQARMNTLILQMADAVAFDSFPGRVKRDALSKTEMSELAELARSNGLNVIPEIKFLTTQAKFLQDQHPDLMFNKETYDPRKAAVYEIAATYLDEVIKIVQPAAIHIGHSEVRGFGRAAREKWLAPGEGPLPAKLFLEDTLKLHQLITARGLRMWMWGDMLLPRDHLPEILTRNWDTRKEYPTLLEHLPRDIVLADWRYFDHGPDYPSVDYLHGLGNEVSGATWHDETAISNFSNYAATRQWETKGMVATTWSLVQKKDWQKVHFIIDRSGKAFWDGG
jgi:hypothetical protein